MKRIARPFTIEVKRSRRSGLPLPPSLPPAAEGIITAPLATPEPEPVEPVHPGRILPALDIKPETPPRRPAGLEAKAARTRTKRAALPAPTKVVAGSAEPPPGPDHVIIGVEIVGPEAGQVREPGKHLRGDFRRGERWKSRLPAMLHRFPPPPKTIKP